MNKGISLCNFEGFSEPLCNRFVCLVVSQSSTKKAQKTQKKLGEKSK
jgi:hypothetical protein